MAQHANATRHAVARGFDFRFGFAAQTITLFVVAGVVLWTTLLSSFLPVHDATHWLRHLLGVIPCH